MAESAAAAAVVQQRVQANSPVSPPADQADIASLMTEIRLLRARVEALEQIVKEIAPPATPVRK